MSSPITDKEIQAQEFLLACLNGETHFRSALMRVVHHGEERACIVAVDREGDSFNLIPLAVLVTSDDVDRHMVPGEELNEVTVRTYYPAIEPDLIEALVPRAVDAFDDDPETDPDKAFDADEKRVGILAGLWYSEHTALEPPASPEGSDEQAWDYRSRVWDACKEILVDKGYIFDRG